MNNQIKNLALHIVELRVDEYGGDFVKQRNKSCEDITIRTCLETFCQ